MNVTQNRDISWLKFNKRVLNESSRDLHPLLERALFLKIASNNLKEFSMIRIASLRSLSNVDPNHIDAYSQKPLKDIIKTLNHEINLQREAILMSGKTLLKALALEKIEFVTLERLNAEEQKNLIHTFKEQFLSLSYQTRISLSEFLLVVKSNHLYRLLKSKKNHFYHLNFMQEPPYAIAIDEKRFIRTENILHAVYEEKKVHYFSANFIRDADLNFDAFDDDELPKKLKALLSSRDQQSLNRVHLKTPDLKEIKPFFIKETNLTGKEILGATDFESWEYLYGFLNQIIDKDHPTLRYATHIPAFPVGLDAQKSLIKQIQKSDQLWHYPYDAFATFERLLHEAAHHPDVKELLITVYRIAQNSKIVEALKLARKNKKKVTVILELRARFDEANNLFYADELKAAGCDVFFGPKKTKIHAKIFVMTLKNNSYITQIGSGNYHEVTALKYTDFAYLTANPEIGLEAYHFFQSLIQKKEVPTFKHLLVGPHHLKEALIKAIEGETKKKEEGYIGFKINALTDKDIIEKLIKASQEGVEIETIIRSIHCLLPGVKGYTETLKIHSLVGRFLEHSRVYVFGKKDPKILIGSSDLMSRNLQRRHEILCPVEDESIKKRLLKLFKLSLKDNLYSARLNDKGQHIMKNDSLPFSVHETLLDASKKGKDYL